LFTADAGVVYHVLSPVLGVSVRICALAIDGRLNLGGQVITVIGYAPGPQSSISAQGGGLSAGYGYVLCQ
jgi:hypothetical protein